MKYAFAAAGLLVISAPLSAAAAMPVASFLAKTEALKRKGPLAIFSGDLKLLMNQVKQDSAELRAANKALEAAGKPKAYCTPAKFAMNEDDIMAAMTQVPAAQRQRTSTKEALRDYIARKHPCPAGR